MANRFLNNITINDEYTLPSSDGAENQIIVTDGAGNLSFDDLGTVTGAVNGVQSNVTYYEVKNSSGSQIVRGKGVMAVGTDGNSGHILIDEMVADGSVEARYFLGVLSETLDNGSIGRVIAFGELDQFNTNGQNGETWTNGQVLWCDPDSAGDFTITEPDGPNVKIPAAFILKASTNGKIQVRVQANEGIHQLHDTKITTQADGELLVWNNTLGVWQNDGTATIDYTNGRVGIGTASPTHLLTLETASSPGLKIKDTTQGATLIAYSQDSNSHVGTFSSHPLIFDTNSTERMRIDSSGNVGIGTTSPAKKLEVDGTVHLGSSGNDVSIGASNSSVIFMLRSGYNYIQASDASGALMFRTGGANNRMIIDSSGNVGIGTTSPSGKLHIVTDANSEFIFTGSSTSGYSTTLHMDDTGLDIGHNSSGRSLNLKTNSLDRLTITGNGNVGIGTTSPDVKLEVIDASPTDGIIADFVNSTNAGGTTAAIKLSNADSEACDVVLGANRVGANFGSDFFISLSDSVDGSNQERFRITEAGNVGIGTNSPTGKLTVVGSGGQTNIESTGYILDLYRDNGMSSIYNSDNYGTLSLGAGGVENYLYVNWNGNVGIGTTSPSYKMHIKGDSTWGLGIDSGASQYSVLEFLENGSVKSQIFNNHPDDSLFIRTTVSSSVRFGTNSSERMRIDSSGNVGIGTTSPGYPLEIAGTSTVSLAYQRTGVSAKKWGFHSDNSNTYWQNLTDNILAFTLSNAGNVGIGTSSPTQKLDVVGNINASGTGTFGSTVTINKSSEALVLKGTDTANDAADNMWLSFKRQNNTRLGYIGVGSSSSDNLIINSDAGTILVRTNAGGVIGTFHNTGVDISGNLDVTGTGTFDGAGVYANVFYDKGNTAYYIDGDGTSKLNHLDCSSTLAFGDFTAGSRGTIFEGYSTNSVVRTDSARLDFYMGKTTTGVGTMMSLTDTGNVGIGTTSPSYKLHVEGNSYINATGNSANLTLGRYSGQPTIKAGSDDSGFLIMDSTGGKAALNWYISDDVVLAVGGGNVGIGTSTPSSSAKLTIMGNQTFGLPGNGSNTSGRFLSIEGNTDAGGEGSGRIFFTEHNSTTASMSNYGMSIGYRGGSTSIVGADGNTWTGLSQIGNGQWGMWGHDNDAAGALIMYGDRAGTYINFAANNLNNVGNLDVTGNIAVNPYKGFSNSGSWTRNATPYGYIDFGPANTNFAHIYTDRPAFYFNKQLQVLGNTVWNSGNDGSGSGLDADLLDGNHASAFATASHTHDDRYYTESEIQTFFNRGYISSQSASNLAVGWYTIATNTGDRALGEFQIWDTTSSRHQSVLFNASHHFGVDNSNDITVLANSRFSTDVFRYIRIKESGTYDGAALQIYIDNATNNVAAAITGANAQVSGWVLKDWIADATNPGDVDNYSSFTEACKIDLDNTRDGGIETTGKFFAQNSIVASGTNTIKAEYDSNHYIQLESNSAGGVLKGLDGGVTTTLVRSYGDSYFNGGNVGIGTTSPSSRLHVAQTLSSSTVPMAYFEADSSTYSTVNVRVDNVDYGSGMSFYRSGTYDNKAIAFINGSTQVGSISINTSSTSYNTTSDYRLKENLIPITDGIERVKQLKPKRFNFIGDNATVDGFVAHEAQEVVPESVTGEKDEVLPNGDPIYQGIDQAKLVPLLTAALQEAVAKIELLESRVQILENR